MKNVSLSLLAVLFVIFQSCKDENCEEIICFTPPESFSFELVNEDGNNAFADTTFHQSKLKVIRVEDGENLLFDTATVAGVQILSVEEVGWEKGLNTYRFSYDSNELFSMRIDGDQVSENCCTFTRYKEKSLLNVEHTVAAVNENHYRVSISY